MMAETRLHYRSWNNGREIKQSGFTPGHDTHTHSLTEHVHHIIYVLNSANELEN